MPPGRGDPAAHRHRRPAGHGRPGGALGVARSRAAMEEAALVLVLWDGSVPRTEEDGALLERAVKLAPTILVQPRPTCPPPPSRSGAGPHAPLRGGERQDRPGLEELAAAVERPLPRRRGGGGGGAAHQRPAGRGRPPGPGGGGAGRGGPGGGGDPRRPAHRRGGGPVRPGGAHRGQRAGGRDRPHLPALLRGEMKGKRPPHMRRAFSVSKKWQKPLF